MCIYVQSSLSDPLSYLVHKTPRGSMHIANTTGTRTGGSKAFYEYPYAVDGANDIWGDATRPSDIKVAVDESLAKVRGNGITPVGYIYRDQIFSVGNATSGWSKTPEVAPYVAEYAKRGFAGDGRGRMFGYATCNWIKKCSATDLPGSPCQGTLSNVLYKGYCFSSDSGTLECGHLTAIDDEYGQKPIAFGAAATTSQAHTSTAWCLSARQHDAAVGRGDAAIDQREAGCDALIARSGCHLSLPDRLTGQGHGHFC
jgi:hypothetical protein